MTAAPLRWTSRDASETESNTTTDTSDGDSDHGASGDDFGVGADPVTACHVVDGVFRASDEAEPMNAVEESASALGDDAGDSRDDRDQRQSLPAQAVSPAPLGPSRLAKAS